MSDENNDSKLAELEAKLTEQTDRIAELSRENAKWRRQAQGKDVPEEVQRRIDDLEEKLSQANADKAEAVKIAKKATADLEAATKRATDIDSAYSNTLKDAALSQALTKAGVTDPVYIEAAKALLGSGVQVVDVDGKRVVKAGEVDLDKHITEWAGSDAGKRFVAAPDTSGSGAGHGSRGNPNNGDKLPEPDDRKGWAARSAARMAADSHED